MRGGGTGDALGPGPDHNRLLHNLGAAQPGYFEDVTEAMGIDLHGEGPRADLGRLLERGPEQRDIDSLAQRDAEPLRAGADRVLQIRIVRARYSGKAGAEVVVVGARGRGSTSGCVSDSVAK